MLDPLGVTCGVICGIPRHNRHVWNNPRNWCACFITKNLFKLIQLGKIGALFGCKTLGM